MYPAMGHAIGAALMERYEFDCEGDRLVGNLHLPQCDAHGVAILTGPLTSVKEQATGASASALAERGNRRPLVRSPLLRRECRTSASARKSRSEDRGHSSGRGLAA